MQKALCYSFVFFVFVFASPAMADPQYVSIQVDSIMAGGTSSNIYHRQCHATEDSYNTHNMHAEFQLCANEENERGIKTHCKLIGKTGTFRLKDLQNYEPQNGDRTARIDLKKVDQIRANFLKRYPSSRPFVRTSLYDQRWCMTMFVLVHYPYTHLHGHSDLDVDAFLNGTQVRVEGEYSGFDVSVTAKPESKDAQTASN